MRVSRKLCQRGSNSTVCFFFLFFLIKGERIQIPLKAGFIIGPLAKRHFKWRFAGGPMMMTRHVMLALYMCSFVIFYGIWTNIAKKIYFRDFPVGSGPLVPTPSGSAHD